MSKSCSPPDFSQFARWLADEHAAGLKLEASPATVERLLQAAATARDETLRHLAAAAPRFETLQLLAAATDDDDARPPELMTARGFRVTLSYDEGETADKASIAVLVQAPIAMIAAVAGETAYLWNGSERFALGQFDADGKAIGVLPAGVEISLSDFRQGNVKLEEPTPPEA